MSMDIAAQEIARVSIVTVHRTVSEIPRFTPFDLVAIKHDYFLAGTGTRTRIFSYM